MGIRRRRPRQLGFYCDQRGRTDRQVAKLGAGNFFHGADKHRQPQFLAVTRLPLLKLLAHRLFLSGFCPVLLKLELADPVPTNLDHVNRFPTNMP